MSNQRNDKGGWVALYVRNDVIYTRENDIFYSDKDCYESVFMKISNLKNSKLIIGCVYRARGHGIRTFNSKFETLTQHISMERTECYLAGDYNINLLNYETHADTKTFVNNLYSNSFFTIDQ